MVSNSNFTIQTSAIREPKRHNSLLCILGFLNRKIYARKGVKQGKANCYFGGILMRFPETMYGLL